MGDSTGSTKLYNLPPPIVYKSLAFRGQEELVFTLNDGKYLSVNTNTTTITTLYKVAGNLNISYINESKPPLFISL